MRTYIRRAASRSAALFPIWSGPSPRPLSLRMRRMCSRASSADCGKSDSFIVALLSHRRAITYSRFHRGKSVESVNFENLVMRRRAIVRLQGGKAHPMIYSREAGNGLSAGADTGRCATASVTGPQSLNWSRGHQHNALGAGAKAKASARPRYPPIL